MPNPVRGPWLGICFRLRGRAEVIRVIAYSPAYVKEGIWEASGAYAEGWNQALLPAALPCGVHYLKLEARGAGATSALKGSLKVVVLR